MGFTTAKTIMQQRSDNVHLTTGCKDLDAILEGTKCELNQLHKQGQFKRLLLDSSQTGITMYGMFWQVA